MFTRTHQELQQKITVARTEVEWSRQIEYLGMILHKRLSFSGHLKRARRRAIGRISQLYPLLSNPVLNPKTGIMLRVQSLRLLLYVPRTTALAALKVLAEGEDLQEFLDKLNRGFFEKILVIENPAEKTATTQKTYGTTKHRTVKEEKPGSTRKISRTQENTQMPPASSRKKDTGERRTEEGSPANQRYDIV
ncbi:hypothetical protein Trydic_g13627 [Trypoxylus dichotomus]